MLEKLKEQVKRLLGMEQTQAMQDKIESLEARIKELQQELQVRGDKSPDKEEISQEEDRKIEEETDKLEKPRIAKIHKRKKIGEILLENRFITKDMLDKALDHNKKFGVGVTQYLLAYGCIDEQQLAQCLCTQFGFPFLPLKSYDIPDEIIKIIPHDIVEKYWLVPVDKREDVITVVMADPLNVKAISEIEDVTNCKVLPFIGLLSDITKVLKDRYKIAIDDKESMRKKASAFFIDTESYKGAERRQARRFPVEFDVHFPIEGQYQKGKTKDVSRTGFLIESEDSLSVDVDLPLNDKNKKSRVKRITQKGFLIESKGALPVGAYFMLQIDLPKDLSPLPIGVVVKVARVTPLEKGKVAMGVEIVKISKEDIDLITKYVASQK